MRRRLFLVLVSVALFGGSTIGAAGTAGAAGAASADPAPGAVAISQLEQATAATLPALKAELGDAYGGAWFDDSGLLHVGVAGPTDATAPQGVQLDPVAVTAATLAALRDRVGADLTSGALGGLDAVSVRTSEPDQTVVVGVTGGAAAAAAAAPALRARYGVGVVAEAIAPPALAERDCSNAVEAALVPKACDSTQSLKSGLQISSPQGSVTVLCSSAFGVHIGPYKGVMTAGHCQETSASASWSIGYGGAAFGASGRKTFFDGFRADSLLVTVPNDRGGPKDCVYESESLCRTVAGYAGGVVTGQTVCKSGYRTEVSCGQVLSPDTTVTYSAEHVSITHVAAACGRVNSGDSGSGVYHVLSSGNAVADGILSGSTTSTSCPAITDLSGDSNLMFFSTWRNSISTAVGFPLRSGYREVGDINGDTCADILAVYNGNLYDNTGDCTGGLTGKPTLFGSGWDAFDTILRPGDFNGDGCSDIIGRTPDGRLLLYLGNCAGGVINGVGQLIGSGWGAFTEVSTPGDFSGDGCPDLIGRTSDGRLLLYVSDCQGHFVNGVGILVGTGFDVYNTMITPGDWSGDGCVDLIGRTPDGSLRVYFGDCAGHFLGSGNYFPGFESFLDIIGPGDFSGDGCSDLIGRYYDGGLRLYAGDCKGGFSGSAVIATGWQSFSAVR